MLYIVVFSFFIVQAILFDYLKLKTMKSFNYYFSMVILILVAGLRWKVGGDTLTYHSKYTELPDIFNFTFESVTLGWEPGFLLLAAICKSVTEEFWFFQLVHAAIVNVLLFRFFKKHTPLVFTAIIIYSIFYFFYFNMEIMREILAICIFITFMYPALQSGNYKKYYILNFIVLFFHLSSIILFVFPLLSKSKLDRTGISRLVVLVAGLIIVFSVFPNVINIFAFSEKIVDKYETYARYSLSIFGMIYNFIVFGVFPYLLINFNQKYYKELQFKELVFPFFFVIAVYLSYSGAGRFINYFGPFMMVFFVNTIYLLAFHKKFSQVKVFAICVLLVGPLLFKISYYRTSLDHIVNGANKYSMYAPYSSIFNKNDYYEYREVLYRQSMRESSER